MVSAAAAYILSLCLVLSTTSAGALYQRQSTSNTTLPVEVVYQYAPVAWVENVAVRPNGWLLPIRTFNSPVLNQIHPDTGELTLVHDFSSAGNAIQGITEMAPDYFALNVLTCNITALSCTQGSVSTWTVDFREQENDHECANDTVVNVRHITEWPSAGFLNGMAALNDHTVLIADSFLGGIWSLDLESGRSELLFTDDSLNPGAANATGVNGIRVRRGLLYFTNSMLGHFGRLPIDPATGNKTGNATLFATGLLGPDDFEVDDHVDMAYVCNGAANQLLKISLNGNGGGVVANIPGPTSARWGRSFGRGGHQERSLYVTNVGGLLQYLQGNITIGGAIDRLDIPS